MDAFAQTTIPTNMHIANIIFTNIILMTDKPNILKHICRLLTNYILCKITQGNNMRRAITCDPVLKLPNEEITFSIHKHKYNLWLTPIIRDLTLIWLLICTPTPRPHLHKDERTNDTRLQ